MEAVEEYKHKASKWLAIDTSTASLAIAAINDGAIAGEVHMSAERNHSMKLVPNIQDMLKGLQWKAKELNGIVVGHGPGSYTGVRIGITVAKTMAWALGIPLVSRSSLETLAFSGWMFRTSQADVGAACWLIPLMDARRGNVYTSIYEMRTSSDNNAFSESMTGDQPRYLNSERESWVSLSEDGIRSLKDWLDELQQRLEQLEMGEKPNEIHFVVDPLETKIIAQLEEFFPSDHIKVVTMRQEMRAEALAWLAYYDSAQNHQSEVHDFIPNYTQLAEAEAKWLEGQKLKTGSAQMK